MKNQTVILTKTEKNIKHKEPNKFFYSLIATVASIVIAFFALLIAGVSPIDYFLGIFLFNFGDFNSFGNFLGQLAWIMPLGLAMVVSLKVGVFNIGSAGQMFFSGFVCFWVGSKIGSSAGLFGIIILMMIAVFIGMMIAGSIALLKIKFKVNEVVTSIMLNWILFYIVAATIDSGDIPQTIDQTLSLSKNILFTGQFANIGIVVSPFLVIGLIFLYKKTNFGFKQGIVGNNPSVADSIGINKNAEYMKALLISGGLAGLAGWIYFTGTNNFLPEPGVQPAGVFYQGITVALLGFNTFIGTIFSSMLITVFVSGSMMGDSWTFGLPATDLILSLMLVMITVSQFFIIYQPGYFRRVKEWMSSNEEEEKC